jgi:hypothetical protein
VVDWTHNISHFGIPVASKKTNPLPANDPVCDPEDVHDFGATSDLCIYCGISAGWFSRHEGKICNARRDLRKLVKANEKKNQLEQQKAVYDSMMAKKHLPFIVSPSSILSLNPADETPIEKPSVERPKRKSIGRKFR